MLIQNETEIVGGLVGDALDSVGNSIKNGIVQGFAAVFKMIFDFTEPIIYWGCQIVILCCVLTYFTSKDKKSIAIGMRTFLIFIVYLTIRSCII